MAQNAEAPGEDWGKPIPWCKWCSLSSVPGLQDAEKLSDGDLSTAAKFCPGSKGGVEITFTFPRAIEVKGLRLYQWGGVSATKWRVLGDESGNGGFAKIAERDDGNKPLPKKWLPIAVGRSSR